MEKEKNVDGNHQKKQISKYHYKAHLIGIIKEMEQIKWRSAGHKWQQRDQYSEDLDNGSIGRH